MRPALAIITGAQSLVVLAKKNTSATHCKLEVLRQSNYIQDGGFWFILIYNIYVRAQIENWLFQAPQEAFFRWRISVPLPVKLLKAIF